MSKPNFATLIVGAALLAPVGLAFAQDALPDATPGTASALLGKSPYAAAMGLDRPPKVYVIPMDGQMGTDIHPTIYERIIKDVKETKPDLIVYRLNSNDGRFSIGWMDEFEAATRNDKVDPRRIASQVLEYRDLATKLHDELREFPAVMFVEDARGMSSLYALAWSYMFMSPSGWIQGLDIVGSLGGGNDADIRAKMFAAWTGIAKGVLELGGHPQELTEALIRPDRELSVDVDGRVTKWRNDDQGTWYLVDDSMEQPAMFRAKTAEDTGLAQGLASDVNDLMLLLGYPEVTMVGAGEKMFGDYKTAWRKRFEESEKWMEEFQQPVRDANELGKRKQILEKMKQSFKQYPAMARLWQWKAGLTEAQIDLLIEDITEKIRAAQKAKERNRGTGTGGGGGKGFGTIK
jgi:hypothetical protein